MIEKRILKKDKPLIHKGTTYQNTKFGEFVEIGVFNVIENAEFGDYSYTSENCFVQNANIGKFSNIAAMVRIGATNHPMERASLHHFTYRRVMYGFDTKDDKDFFEKREADKIHVGHDTWIGHGSIILPGVTIGNGAVVGAGSVVTKDIPAYAIAVGNPAKVIKMRFEKNIIDNLEKIKWWDFSHDKIKDNFSYFIGDINDFVEKFKGVDIVD